MRLRTTCRLVVRVTPHPFVFAVWILSVVFSLGLLQGKGSNASKTKRAREDAEKRKSEEGRGGGGAAGMAER
jgi:hypothetical protein